MLGPVGGATTTFFLSLSIGSGSSESVCGGGEGSHFVGFFGTRGRGRRGTERCVVSVWEWYGDRLLVVRTLMPKSENNVT